MTLAALIRRDNYYSRGVSVRLMYATPGVLFVNIIRLRSWVFFCSSLEVPMTLQDIRTGSLWGKDFCSHFSLRAWSCWPDTGVVVKIIIAGHEQ